MENPLPPSLDYLAPIAAAGAGLLANAAILVADVAQDAIPSFTAISNLSCVGVVSFLVWYLVTKGIPKLAEDSRQEREKMQERFYAHMAEESQSNRAALESLQQRMHEDSSHVVTALNRLCDQMTK